MKISSSNDLFYIEKIDMNKIKLIIGLIIFKLKVDLIIM